MKSVHISDETHKQLKRHALDSGKKLQEIVAEILTAHVSKIAKKAKS